MTTSRFDRDSIPRELLDMSCWASVDHTQLPSEQREAYLRREQAVRQYLSPTPPSNQDIELSTGVHRTQIARLAQKCLAQHPDGKIFGFRGLLVYAHVQRYTRTKRTGPALKSGTKRPGAAGLLSLLLRRHPELETYLKKEASRRRAGSSSVKEIQRSARKSHAGFIKLCRSLGIPETEYPFNVEGLAFRSVQTYLKKVTSSLDGSGPANNAGTSRQQDATTTTTPYAIVEIDGHKIDLRMTIMIEDPYGMEMPVEVAKIWLLVVEDVASRAILGYHLALSTEYSSDDVITAIQAALVPRAPIQNFTVKGLKYAETAGFPSQVFEPLEYACWDQVRLDNAKSHLAERTVKVLSEIIGCEVDFGPPRQPRKRPFVERFFRTFCDHLSHRIPGTTGSSPSDGLRQLTSNNNLSILIRLHELEELIDVVLSNYNGEPHGGLGGRSPLEKLRHFLSNQESGALVRTIPPDRRSTLCLLQEGKRLFIRSYPEQGVGPHVNFIGVKYTSDVLKNSPGLVGQRVNAYYDRSDIRTLTVFFENGEELGILTAAKQWSLTKHSVRLRREIMRLVRRNKLKCGLEDDAVRVFLKYKKASSRRSKKDALAVAKTQKMIEPSAVRVPHISDEKLIPQQDEGHPVVKALRVKKTILF